MEDTAVEGYSASWELLNDHWSHITSRCNNTIFEKLTPKSSVLILHSLLSSI